MYISIGISTLRFCKTIVQFSGLVLSIAFFGEQELTKPSTGSMNSVSSVFPMRSCLYKTCFLILFFEGGIDWFSLIAGDSVLFNLKLLGSSNLDKFGMIQSYSTFFFLQLALNKPPIGSGQFLPLIWCGQNQDELETLIREVDEFDPTALAKPTGEAQLGTSKNGTKQSWAKIRLGKACWYLVLGQMSCLNLSSDSCCLGDCGGCVRTTRRRRVIHVAIAAGRVTCNRPM